MRSPSFVPLCRNLSLTCNHLLLKCRSHRRVRLAHSVGPRASPAQQAPPPTGPVGRSLRVHGRGLDGKRHHVQGAAGSGVRRRRQCNGLKVRLLHWQGDLGSELTFLFLVSSLIAGSATSSCSAPTIRLHQRRLDSPDLTLPAALPTQVRRTTRPMLTATSPVRHRFCCFVVPRHA